MRAPTLIVFAALLGLAIAFEAAEHSFKGNQAFNLMFDKTEALRKVLGNSRTVHILKNKAELNYGSIVALSGDFIGCVDQRLSAETNLDKRKKQFNKCFVEMLNSDAATNKFVKEIVKNGFFTREEKALRDKDEAARVQEIQNLVDSYFLITAEPPRPPSKGDVGTVDFAAHTALRNKMLSLASNNEDHFEDPDKSQQPRPFHDWDSSRAYIGGHAWAVDRAIAASKEADPDQKKIILREAFMANAMADHFLHDMFASGHVRTPAAAFRKFCHQPMHPIDMNKVNDISNGDTIAKVMHGEDNRLGLSVSNLRGDEWVEFGDAMLFQKQAQSFVKRGTIEGTDPIKVEVAWGEEPDLATLAISISIDEVWDAFKTGAFPKGRIGPVNGALRVAPSKLSGGNMPPLVKWFFDENPSKTTPGITSNKSPRNRYFVRDPMVPGKSSDEYKYQPIWESQCKRVADLALLYDQGMSADEVAAVQKTWTLAYKFPTALKKNPKYLMHMASKVISGAVTFSNWVSSDGKTSAAEGDLDAAGGSRKSN